MRLLKLCLTAAGALALAASLAPAGTAPEPQRVTFPSADGRTTLVGYLFRPMQAQAGPLPAVVMMHGRAGAYSTLARGVYDASTLSKRHKAWGGIWADQGYVALMVDGFGPRGYPQGFGRFSYDQRPAELNEVTVRPLDAYGAAAYLRSLPEVAPDQIALQGWSNGGSATLAAMATGAGRTPTTGFRAALAFYPACGLKNAFDAGYLPYAPVRVFMGSADEEVSPRQCRELVEKSRAQGGNIAIRTYQGASHSFDDPSPSRRRVTANAKATEDAVARALDLLAHELSGKTKP